MTQRVCFDCGSLNIGFPDGSDDDPEWLRDLREIPGWDVLGQPHEYLLWRGDWAYEFTDDELEEGADSFASTQKKTLEGYNNLVRAFKTHLRKGYHLKSPGSLRHVADNQTRRY